MKTLKIRELAISGISIVLLCLACNDSKYLKEQLADEKGISWVNVSNCRNEIVKQVFSTGFTLYSSGYAFEFNYDFLTGEEKPITIKCFDCDPPKRIRDAFVKWKLSKDTLLIGKMDPLVINKIKDDTLFVTYILGPNKIKCNSILMKVK